MITIFFALVSLLSFRVRSRAWSLSSSPCGIRWPSCGGSDDLLLAAENHPAYEQERLDFASRATVELIGIATGAAPLPIRALALWYGIGTDRRL